LIEILYCGVCHSDIHQARDEWGGAIFPMVPGHEVVGRVVKVGKGVRKVRVGDPVGVGCFVDSCRKCSHCKDYQENYCDHHFSLTYNGTEMDQKTPTYGGYSDRIVVDERFVLKVPKNLDLARVAPLLCAGITTYSPLKHWKIGKGHKLGVMGLGGLGHMAVKFGKALGAHVSVISTSPSKQADAKKLGAKNFILSSDAAALEKNAVVLAFASTLVGFNNEYLAHLSGIAPGQWRREFSGLLSAIGTTFIGFVFLLFAENTLLRQIALVCMGGSFGFIAFMLVQQGQAKLTKFRTIRIPAIYLNLKVYTLLAAVLVTGVMWGPRIDFRTSLVSFRFDTPMMQRNVSHFSERLAQFGLKDAKVIGVKFDDFNKMINDESLRVGGSMASVLAFGKRLVKARSDAGATPTRLAAAMKKFESALFARGIELSQPLSVPQSFVTDWNGYAKWMADYSPVPQMAVSASKIWLVDTDGDISRQLGDAKIVHDTFAASPMSFYDSVLTEAQQHMLLLLAVALGVMALYLRPLQRSWVHVMQIVVPLVAALALLRWVLPVVVQDGVNLVHVAGLFFIMTVALDYSSIAVSSKFDAEAISKLALTGAISFIGFASLIFATHPMIKSLGVTVALGIAVSWIFGVCVRLRPPMTVGGVREA